MCISPGIQFSLRNKLGPCLGFFLVDHHNSRCQCLAQSNIWGIQHRPETKIAVKNEKHPISKSLTEPKVFQLTKCFFVARKSKNSKGAFNFANVQKVFDYLENRTPNILLSSHSHHAQALTLITRPSDKESGGRKL